MNETSTPFHVLVVGCGVIGSVYGGQVALAGQQLWVLAHGEREQEIARNGIKLHDVSQSAQQTARTKLAQTADEREYDLVIVAVQAGQLASTFPALRQLKGSPHIVFFGNNPDGRAAIPTDLPGTYELAFPGVGGSLQEGVIEYAHIAEQPTTFEAKVSPISKKLQAILEAQGFKVQHIANIDGWLQYHTVLISCISAALLRTEVSPVQLGNDRRLLHLMCRAIEEGFRALGAQHVQGLPQNLRILHSVFLRPMARQYWGKLMRSPKGELFFAGHVRHATDEVHDLMRWTLEHTMQSQVDISHLKELLLTV
ncbi:MAG TPA: 2-dehydropantoate 2-reductase N-terminal domain-containing protein [Patescibacteria group bacterium]|nr:2-dehydropantoate 2-reductase N-terminal domain-containing protein [Patescibacteria group bacterium]